MVISSVCVFENKMFEKLHLVFKQFENNEKIDTT